MPCASRGTLPNRRRSPRCEPADRIRGAVDFGDGCRGDGTSRVNDPHLVWMDRGGRRIGPVALPGAYDPALSPDGTMLAVTRNVPQTGIGIWVFDLKREIPVRITRDAATTSIPVWSPDGKYVAFRSTKGDRLDVLYRKLADGSGSEELLLDMEGSQPTDWSADGRFILFHSAFGGSGSWHDLWVLPLADRKAKRLGSAPLRPSLTPPAPLPPNKPSISGSPAPRLLRAPPHSSLPPLPPSRLSLSPGEKPFDAPTLPGRPFPPPLPQSPPPSPRNAPPLYPPIPRNSSDTPPASTPPLHLSIELGSIPCSPPRSPPLAVDEAAATHHCSPSLRHLSLRRPLPLLARSPRNPHPSPAPRPPPGLDPATPPTSTPANKSTPPPNLRFPPAPSGPSPRCCSSLPPPPPPRPPPPTHIIPRPTPPPPTPLLHSASEAQGVLSPDMQWLAFASESGVREVYVQPFPPTRPKTLVSRGGGGEPRWRSDGRELFYVSPIGG